MAITENKKEYYQALINKHAAYKPKNTKILKASWLDSKLGPMLAIADDEMLYLLEFVERQGLECEMERLRQKIPAVIIPGQTPVINSIEHELKLYFNGQLRNFHTPLYFLGTSFQKKAWEALQKIPYGETRSYSDQATAVGDPAAVRAVARANAANHLAIVIPCHRVINLNKGLGGYAGGIARKQWLIELEKANTSGHDLLCGIGLTDFSGS